MPRTLNLWFIAALVLVVFIAANVVAGFALRGARIDATEGHIYTLTQGSGHIAQSPKEPVRLTFYYSSKAAQGQASLQTYATRLRETLQEYARVSQGKVILTIVDPEPSSEEEERAVADGVQPARAQGSVDPLYFGLVGTNTIDGREVIPFFDPSRENFLEYDISRMLSTLANPVKPVVAWISPLQLEGGYTMDPRTRQPTPTRIFKCIEDVKQLYEVRRLDMGVSEIPKDVQVLMVVHPKGLSEGTQYAIDQFVLRGGRLLLFADPLCESEQVQGMMPEASGRASDLNRVLRAWGVETSDLVIADQEIAVSVMTSRQDTQATPFVLWLEGKEAGLNKEDPVTGQVSRVTFASTGFVRAYKPSDGPAPALSATITPIITTSAHASTMSVNAIEFPADPKKLFAAFVPGNEKLTIAARLAGKVASAFPDGPPKNPEGQPVAPAEAHLKESKDSIHVVVFGDADVLSDSMWMQRVQFLPGMESMRKLADNGDLLLAAVDNFSGSDDLIAVRARKGAQRPFTRVDEMEKNAKQQFQKELTRLEDKSKQTQQRLTELQAQRGNDASGGLILSPEQVAEVEKLRKEQAETGKQLRVVQHSLNKDIDKLGSLLFFLNAGLMPLALIAAGLVVWFVRSMQRGRATKA